MANITIYSNNQLVKLSDKRAKYALEQTRNIINDCIQDAIYAYYRELNPNYYRRLYKFMISLVKTEVVKIGNRLCCHVKIDEDYLSYQYYDDGEPTVTGLDVINMANEGSHGGVYDDDFSHFWDDAMQALGGEFGIMAILKKKLENSGLNIGK